METVSKTFRTSAAFAL